MRASESHLYVMQNAFGRIKIGRSADPERRRRDLESSSGHKVVLVRIFLNRGAEEAIIHQKLREFRCIGEWFLGTAEAKRAICEAVQARLRFCFRHKADHQDAATVLAHREAFLRGFGIEIPLHKLDAVYDAEIEVKEGRMSLDQLNQQRASIGLLPVDKDFRPQP